MIPFEVCPFCLSREFEDGPRGGASINVTCKDCGARFNLLRHEAVPQQMLIETLSGPTRMRQ